ncbi:uncharacterized protein LOC133202682 [Saccostrea echinata]|uniref:uncharacterized protein LOC133202682 n=1 Tax=Saccostrea echinata TaxID=191078 RepID=UPI002A7EFEC3|nr:uncharacterized protein LOC133202682 [Saccostrea echinata]
MMPGHSTSTRVFNPLDILANAASLIPKTMTPQQDTVPTDPAPAQDNVSTTEDLEKMFDEHNYGNSKKVVVNKISHSSFSTDLGPKGKDGAKLKDSSRRVIVTVVNRSGDQRVVKTFSSVKAVRNILKTDVSIGKETEEEKRDDSSCVKTFPIPPNDFLSEKSKQSEKATTDAKFQVDVATPGSVNLKSIDTYQAVQNTCENETQSNTSIGENTGSNSSHPSNKEQVNQAQVTCVNTNSPEEDQGESSSATCPSSHQCVKESFTCKQSQEMPEHSPSQDDVCESLSLVKEGNSEHEDKQKIESDHTAVVCDSSQELNPKMTISPPGTCFEVSSVEEETDHCAIPNDEKPSVLSDHKHQLSGEFSGKRDYIGSPDGCCFKLFEDTSDSESWRYEGNRGDIRLSLDLDSPKSERNENPSPASEMGKRKSSDTSLDPLLSPRTYEENDVQKFSNAALISNMDHCYAGLTNNLKPESNMEDQIQKSELNSSSSSEDCHKNSINLKDLLRNGKNVICGPFDKSSPSKINQKRDAIVAVMVTEPQVAKTVQTTVPKEVSPKFGKYRIGTFASVSNTAMGLESPTSKKGPVKATSLLTNTVYTNSVPLVVSHGARTSQFSDLTLQQVLERKWVSVTDHDHDYCLPRIQGPPLLSKQKKSEDKKAKKVVQTDSTDTESNDEFIPDEDSLPNSPQPTPTLRHRAHKSEKVADYIKGGTSDSKLKITGKYQDDYIYFLNTKLRSRRRTPSVDQKSLPPNKIVVPLPKPGDIVVPHLTDADLELIKSGNSDKIPQKMCSNTDNLQGLKPAVQPQTSGTSSSNISDEESKLINTILSMENGEQNPPGPVTEIPNFGETPALFGGTNDDILNLTPEQMEILFNAMDEVQSESPDISTAGNKFNLDVPSSTVTTTFPSGENEVSDQKTFQNSNDLEMVPTTKPSADVSVATGSSYPELAAIPQEKSSLDLFGSEMKLFPEASAISSETSQKPETSTVETDSSAPWIVTVSMFWNDLPAIMIDNAPFVRLVDIHKQILPAKDTGILKKRCQLLGIEVLNCTEMQRYFLVQYGKAFNSKSTLIISKDDAKSLIGYYVNPGSHPPRVRCRSIGGKAKVTVQNNRNKKNHSKAAVEVEEEKREVNPMPAVPPSSLVSQNPLTSRTRHKKINFLEMLKGDSNNNNTTTEESENDIKEEAKPEKIKRASKSKTGGEPKCSTEKRQKSEQSVEETTNSTSEESGKNKSDQNKLGQKMELIKKDVILQPKKLKFGKSKKYPGPLKVKWTVFSNNKKQSTEEKEETGSEIRENVLSVVHKDMTLKNGQGGRMQAGNVLLDLYKGPLDPCIRCCTCEKLFSIDNFLKHLHDVNGSNKLLVVRQPQTFALRDLNPTSYQKKLWEHFFKKRKAYNDELKQKRLDRMDKEKQTPLQSRESSDVRISGRKRRPKQLHPIENYRYNLPKGSVNASDKMESSDDPPPSKCRKSVDTSTSCEDMNCEEGTESVVTLTNGPEVISFTALETERAFDV